MTDTVTVKIGDQSIEVNVTALNEFKEQSFEILRKLEDQKYNFKSLVEEAAENTGLPKKIISKYLKDSFADKTKEASEVGEAFKTLDGALA